MSNIASQMCQVCQTNISKYRCPRCRLCTCSLSCVRQHKELYECSGQRNKTAFVSLNNFNDNHLLNDYRFLEESQRDVETASRKKQFSNARFSPRYLQILKKNAMKRGVSLRVMPATMSRHCLNHSYYNIKDNVVDWTVEWLLHDASLKCYSKHLDSLAILECLEALLEQQTKDLQDRCFKKTDKKSDYNSDQKITDPKNIDQLITHPKINGLENTEEQNTDQQSTDHQNVPGVLKLKPEDLSVFLKVERMCKSGDDDRKYIRLEMKAKLCDVLKGKTILEFPTFVISPLSVSDYYEKCSFETGLETI